MQSFFLSLDFTLQNYPTAVTPSIRLHDNPANDPLQSHYMVRPPQQPSGTVGHKKTAFRCGMRFS